MRSILQLYRNAYGGLSSAAWMLALVMFVNRSGAMVVPFLSLYLTEALHFTLEQTGLILSVFGLGSMVGAYAGGWLTDRVGHFWVQFVSLVLGGSMFFVLVNLEQFETFAVGIFVLSVITECLRPANASSVSFYAKPENVTRAFSLNRMAINLGFSIGPALGGLLAAVSYRWLFLGDGITCLVAGLAFFLFFRNRKGKQIALSEEGAAHPASSQAWNSPYTDWPFVLFVLLCMGFAVTFFQFFTTLPLYYRQVYLLPENQIGMLLGLNGFIVFAFEMILVYLIGQRISPWRLIVGGMVLLALGFFLLNLSTGLAVLVLSMVLLSFAEILAMPFMATLTVQRSGPHNRGAYMGLYSLAYSTAFMLAPLLGTFLLSNFGFTTLWWAIGSLALVTGAGFWLVRGIVEKTKKQEPVVVS